MKYFFFILISISLLLGCNSDDNDTTETSVENKKPILKRITTENFEANYNEEGRLDNHKIDGEDFVKVSYDANNKMKKFARVDINKISIEFFYDANRLARLEFAIINNFDQQETQEFDLEYTANTITLKKITGHNSEYIAVHTFEDGDFDKLTSYKIIDTSTGNITYEERYQYNNDNVITNTFPVGTTNPFDQIYNMKYDRNPNPYAESHSADYLNYIFIKTAFNFPNPSSLMRLELPQFAQNNLLTSYVENATVEIQYNDKNYPVKLEDVNENGEVILTRLYEYH